MNAIRDWWHRLLPRPRGSRQPAVEIRIGERLLTDVRSHVENFRHGEQAGFLFCAWSSTSDRTVLLPVDWEPIPESAVTSRGGEFGLAWHPKFNAEAIARADDEEAALVLVHSHGFTDNPHLSADDRRNAAELFPGVSRLLDGRVSGSVVLGRKAACGQFWRDGQSVGELAGLVVLGDSIVHWAPGKRTTRAPRLRDRLDRQTRALGVESERRLVGARVAVVGCSGGGSHVCQQLAHLGIGTLIPIDDDLVEEANLARMVGATPADIDCVLKTTVMERMIAGIDPEVSVEAVPYRFPAPEAIAAIKSADLVVACVDSFRVREQLNVFCRRHLLPLIDVGLGIQTSDQGELISANGQVIVLTPDSPCLRCGPLLSDAVLESEREAQPPGYDSNPNAGDPQVISMNGVLASEACNATLDMITGFSGGSRGPGWWQYDARIGALSRGELPPARPECPACAELGRGDPLLQSNRSRR